MVQVYSYGMEDENTFYMEGEIDGEEDVELFGKRFQEGLQTHMGTVYALNYYYFHRAFKVTYPFKLRFRVAYDRECYFKMGWENGYDYS
ncbi:hypothetical protein [Adhaeribacter radiodurans]|uniref:Uncharacterized protein n=1 Tax=Adhaeribacter radiodurans TaxID=2745197 RepID=A0A7L7LCG1_9BACT|nr:hypothetical protein [Adhaeribacter radiodurans]QMU30501.1 hypothetical protein HUW48_21855 [Adhaeribacter radiodurans]